MKKLCLLAVLLVLLFAGCATAPSVKVNQIEKIVTTNKPAKDVFDLSMLWMNKSFVSAKNVIQYSDKASGIITGKAICDSGYEWRGPALLNTTVTYTLTIQIKNNESRLLFNAIELEMHGTGPSASFAVPMTQKAYNVFIAQTEVLTQSYSDYIKNNSVEW